MAESYRFTWQGGTGEIVEKKSRFIATVAPVKSEEEAQSFIEHIRKQYWDARHSCTAFTIGSRHQLTRCSDDGEPAGTAGRPMLDVLLGENIHDTCAVVTRYFGGTLLGTGGLVRAYSGALREALNHAVILEKQKGVRLEIRSDYADLGRIQYLIGQNQISILSSSYTDSVFLETLVPEDRFDSFYASITEGTAGKAGLTRGSFAWYALQDGKVILFDKEGEE